MPALRAGLLHGRRPNLAPPAQRNRQKSHAGLQPYLLQLEPKMQCSAQAQLQSAITDSQQLCSHDLRCAAAQIQFGIQSLHSAVTTSDLPVSAPPHITDQICQLCAQSHSHSLRSQRNALLTCPERCAATQIQFGIQSLGSAVTTSDLPISAPHLHRSDLPALRAVTLTISDLPVFPSCAAA